MSTNYKDKFSEASEELQDKSGFVCETCKTTYHKKDAVKKDMSCCGRTLKELVQESFGP